MSWLVRTNCEERICLNLLSPLAQGRELKSKQDEHSYGQEQVAPRAGAGIEIYIFIDGFPEASGRPSRRGGN